MKILIERSMKKSCRNQITQNLELKKIKGKDHRAYVKQKGYNNSFNSWIDKKRCCIVAISR